MQRWQRLFFLVVLGHFGLTVLTGFVWNELMTALVSHRSPALLHATYISFYMFVPFCQPFFWPLSDWTSRSGHFSLLHSSAATQAVELLAIAFINSLLVVAILAAAAWLVHAARSHGNQQSVTS